MYEKITYYSRMSQTLHVPVPAAAPPAGYQAQGVNFANVAVNDTYFSSTGLGAGAVDGTSGMLSFWFKQYDTANRAIYFPLSAANNRIALQIVGADYSLSLAMTDNVGANIVVLQSPINLAVPGSWHHIAASWISGGTRSQLYVDGSSDLDSSVNNAGNINYADMTGTTFCFNGGAQLDVADYYFNISASLDLLTDLGKFYSTPGSAGGHPVDLGDTGTSPTGSQPLIYFSLRPGDSTPNNFVNNLGSGGAFTITGPVPNLSLSATNP